jgi:pimeloyl-ACP methyl ester carboxylesterase
MSEVWIVPGLAVHRYAMPAAEALRTHGHRVRLLDPPGWPGRPPELDRYGRCVAEELSQLSGRLDLLIGLSVGTQAAAVAAAEDPGVARLLLISPTIDPAQRSRHALLAGWLRGENHPDSPGIRTHLPDWRRAGLARIYRTFASVLRVRLEQVLPHVDAAVTIAHADHDQLSSHAYAAELAQLCRARFLVLPDAPHSWPVGDDAGFIALVHGLLASD